MPPKRPREEEARMIGDADDSAAPVIIPVPAAADAAAAAGEEEEATTTPSKSVRLNLTAAEESGGDAQEESKSLGAMIFVAEESSSDAAAAVGQQHVVTPALVRLRRKRAAAAANATATTTTATTTTISDQPFEYESSSTSGGARRALFPTPAEAAAASSSTAMHAVVDHPATITPYSRRGAGSGGTVAAVPVVVTAKRKLIFGRLVTETVVQENVRQVYSIIRKFTGGIGGNGSHGPIYGELTMGSMQKMVNLMKEHTGLSCTSRFIDVGSGIGKPNFHVAQDPGVELSYGIEIEADRWLLGMSCLKQVLNIAASQQQQQTEAAVSPSSMPSENLVLQHRVLFEHGDIRNAKTFDPFTHVYMFSIGFPPQLWITLSEIWNQSTSPYMICFHSPKDVIKNYEFDVDLVTQMPTSMHGSKEGHTGYIYRRSKKSATSTATRRGGEGRECCDPLFRSAQETVKCGLPAIKAKVDAKVEEKMNNNRTKRVPRGKTTAT